MRMIFDVSFKPQPPFEHARLMKLAENKGFAQGWIADNTNRRDVFAVLTMCAQLTSRIRLGPGVAGLAMRTPPQIASAIATVNEISGGRAVLGLGSGGGSVEIFNLGRPNLTRVAELLVQIKAELQGSAGRVNEKVEREWLPWAKVPVYWGCTGPKSIQLGAKSCDGVLAMSGITPELIDYALSQAKIGAKEGGRTLSDLDVVLTTTCAISSDHLTARKEVASIGSGIAYHCFISKGFPYPKHLIKAGECLKEAFAKQVNQSESPIRYFTDEMIDTFCFAGTPAYVVRKIESVAASGLKHMLINFSSVEDKTSAITSFGDEIISVFS